MAETTTLSRIRAASPCSEGWVGILSAVGKTAADDEPLTYASFINTNGLSQAIWAFRAEPEKAGVWRGFVLSLLREVQSLIVDSRSIEAVKTLARHANGEATNDELAVAEKEALQAMRDNAGKWTPEQQLAHNAVRNAMNTKAHEAAELVSVDLMSLVGLARQTEIYLATVGVE